MSFLTIHGPLLPTGGKPPSKKSKKAVVVVPDDSTDGSTDEDRPLRTRKAPKKPSEEEDAAESMPLSSRKQNAVTSPTGSVEPKRPKPTPKPVPKRKKAQSTVALVSSEEDEDEDRPLTQRPKSQPVARLVASEAEESQAEPDGDEDMTPNGRKNKAGKSPPGSADPKRSKPLQKEENVVDKAFKRAMAERVPYASPDGDEVDSDFEHWRPAPPGQVEQKRVPCCSG